MTQAIITLFDSLSRLRGRSFLPAAKRRWSIGGARANPAVRQVDQSMDVLERAMTALHNRSVRRQWHRELKSLDDRQLSDIGVSRTDVERTVGRLRFWI